MTYRHLVVSYDVVDDRKRFQLARLLKGYLERVQKSVFEGVIADRRLEPMKRGIEKKIDREEDSVRIYTLCERCASAVELIGTGVYVEREDEDVVV
jgi:CRISPR-associated protein Cas2